MSTLLIIHICAVAFWFGVVGCETVIEQSRADSHEHGFAVARNHFWIDVLLEIPTALTVLVTGLLMLTPELLATPLFILKIALGGFTVAINLYCFIPVARRKLYASDQQLNAVIEHSRIIDRVSLLGIPAAVGALLIGILGSF